MRARRWITTLAAGGAVALGSTLALPTANAAPLPSKCTQAFLQRDVRCTFSYTGAQQVFTVPAGVHSVFLIAVGAGGGDRRGSGLSPTRAAKKFTSIAVRPGQKLYVYVGGQGQHNTRGTTLGLGGYNGGGSGYPNGGGGASDVRLVGGAADNPASLTKRVVVAAGAGGSAANRGGNGGIPGDSQGLAGGGGAAGQSYGGTPAGDGGRGGFGVGGTASVTGGGGGGGGWYGGAGGYRGGGGGAGSSFPTTGLSPQVSDNGSHVTIAYSGACTPFCFGS